MNAQSTPVALAENDPKFPKYFDIDLSEIVEKDVNPVVTVDKSPLTPKRKHRRGVVDVVLGAQWGDEGKGKLVDILSSKYSICARVAGGSNAGHTIVVDVRDIFIANTIYFVIIYPIVFVPYSRARNTSFTWSLRVF